MRPPYFVIPEDAETACMRAYYLGIWVGQLGCWGLVLDAHNKVIVNYPFILHRVPQPMFDGDKT